MLFAIFKHNKYNFMNKIRSINKPWSNMIKLNALRKCFMVTLVSAVQSTPLVVSI